MYAVIETGGKQYTVRKGETLDVEKLEGQVGEKLELTVLLVSDGSSVVAGAQASGKKVTAEILSTFKGKKTIVYKYKPKKNVRKKAGHRQNYTRIKILDIA